MQLCRDSHVALRSADLAVVASGTASLEAALIGVPMIIVYKISRPTNVVVRAAIAAGLIDSYTVGLPNLVARRSIVPELLQQNATSESIAREVTELLENPARRMRMQQQYAAIADALHGNDPVADVAAGVLGWADAHRLAALEHAPYGSSPANTRLPAPEIE
jgi:lipid-A-disaccharide synthase